MMRIHLLILILTLAGAGTGCQLTRGIFRQPFRQQESKIVQPAIPATMSRDELVDYLNQVNQGLRSWRCMDTDVHVSMPGLPLPKLTGRFACETPSHFRLKSDNFASSADFGSNQEICWAYVKPGESAVLTWKHEDSYLLQQLPGGLPRLEPEWLMTVLGIQPLDPSQYELQNPPQGSRELWLVSVEDAPDGTSLRRVIKVDTVQGLVREHALYDNNRQHLLRAHLSDYRSCGGYSLPHTVRIEFPQHRTKLTLSFRRIETDCEIDDALWHPPTGNNLETVDLGEVMRAQAMRDGRGLRNPASDRNSRTVIVTGHETMLDGPASPNPHQPNQGENHRREFSPAELDDDLSGKTLEELRRDAALNADPELEADAESAVPDFDIITPSPPPRRSIWPWKWRRS